MGPVVDETTAGSDGNLILRRRPLDAEMFTAWRGREIYVALAALKQLRAYWDATTGQRWFTMVWDDDQGLYQTLIHDLYFAMGQRPDLGTATAELRNLVPDLPPDSDLALILDEEIRGHIFDYLTRARQMLIAILIAEGGAPAVNPADPLFVTFDAEIGLMARNAISACDAKAVELGLMKPATLAKARTGRPRGRTWERSALLAAASTFIEGNSDARRAAFLQRVGISERNWKRYTKDYGFTWSELRRECHKSRAT